MITQATKNPPKRACQGFGALSLWRAVSASSIRSDGTPCSRTQSASHRGSLRGTSTRLRCSGVAGRPRLAGGLVSGCMSVEDEIGTELVGVSLDVCVEELLIGLPVLGAAQFLTDLVVHQVDGGIEVEGLAVVFDGGHLHVASPGCVDRTALSMGINVPQQLDRVKHFLWHNKTVTHWRAA